MPTFKRKNNYTEKQLQAFCREKVTEAFDVLAARYVNKLLTSIRFLFPDEQQAEDAAMISLQKCYLQMSEKQEEIGNIPAWLYRVAMNVMLDFFVKNKQRQRDVYYEIIEDKLPDEPRGPFDVEKDWQLNVLTFEISRLKREHKDVIVQQFVYGKRAQEIADNLGLPVEKVYILLKAAKKKLKENCIKHEPPK